MSEKQGFSVLLEALYGIVFPKLGRKEVKRKIAAESTEEFFDRLTGVGALMFFVGFVTISIALISDKVPIDGVGALGLINPLYGWAVLAIIWIILHVVGIVTRGGISPLEYLGLKPKGQITQYLIIISKILLGILLIISPYFIIPTSFGNQTVVDKIVETAFGLGILSALLAPIYYGIGLLGLSIEEIIHEDQAQSDSVQPNPDEPRS